MQNCTTAVSRSLLGDLPRRYGSRSLRCASGVLREDLRRSGPGGVTPSLLLRPFGAASGVLREGLRETHAEQQSNTKDTKDTKE